MLSGEAGLVRSRWSAPIAVLLAAAPIQAQSRYAPVGLFIGSIEEGARIFTPARLLPREHPEAMGHDFPTVHQLHGTESYGLVWLGEQAGYRLSTTLQRYPQEPSPAWVFPDFAPPPDSSDLTSARVVHRAGNETPLPGLKAVLFDEAEPVLFLVDTRGLSLRERGMERATAMGLDVTRERFLEALRSAAVLGDTGGLYAVVFGR